MKDKKDLRKLKQFGNGKLDEFLLSSCFIIQMRQLQSFNPLPYHLLIPKKIDDLLNKVLQVIGAGRYHIIDMESEKHGDYR